MIMRSFGHALCTPGVGAEENRFDEELLSHS
jgi:hypothetical protein